MKKLWDWLDARTGLGALLTPLGAIRLPGGARWGHVFGSILLALLLVQVATGVALMTAYAPSTQTAWASVFHLQYALPGGLWVRAIHRAASHALVIALLLHIARVVAARAYRAPREFVWWGGLAMFGLTLAFVMTGFPLPWDQWGYWVSRIEIGIVGSTPVLGPLLQRMVQGGAQYNSLTLTRFYTLHVAVLPVVMALLVWLHVALLKRFGLAAPKGVADDAPGESYWPAQAWRDALAVFASVAVLVAYAKIRGVALDGPADATSLYPARPVWFFMPLSQLLHMFSGPMQMVGTMVIPGALTTYLVALPFLDPPGATGARRALALAPIVLSLVGATALGVEMYRHDLHDVAYQRARTEAIDKAARARALARRGIPPEGPLEMVRNDPVARPRELFAEHCGTCHSVRGLADHRGGPVLDGFGSRGWAVAFLNNPHDDVFMGRVQDPDRAMNMGSQARRLRRESDDAIDAVGAYLASQGAEGNGPDAALAARGSAIYHRSCTTCHQGSGDTSDSAAEDRDAPNLDGWGSRVWIRSQILDSAAHENYGTRNRMPRFADTFSARELDMLVGFVYGLRSTAAPVVQAPAPPAAPPPETAPPAAPAP